MIYNNLGSSRAQRWTIVISETVLAIIAAWLLLLGGVTTVATWFHADIRLALPFRREVLFVFVAVTYIRMTTMVAVLLKRNIGWEEAIAVPFAFAVYYVGFALLGGMRRIPFGWWDVLAVVLFIAGSATNTTSELLRHHWKRDPTNKGKLYSGGLFHFSRHINYFGDVIWVSGWALFTRNPWSAIIPALLFCMFAFYNGPLLDKHLASKYGKQFEEYRKHVKALVPYIL